MTKVKSANDNTKSVLKKCKDWCINMQLQCNREMLQLKHITYIFFYKSEIMYIL